MKMQELSTKICRKLGFFLNKIPETIRFIITKEKILLNVWMNLNNNKVLQSNLGDELNFYIIKSLSPKPLFNLSNIFTKRHENIMAIGSIIESHTNKYSIIWGSGAMLGGSHILKEKPKKVLAVRGPLTREYLLSQDIECPEIYGDPALLLPKIYQPKVIKKYKLGVIPHYVDFDNENLANLKQDPEVRIIDLKNYKEWQNVIDEICECEFIISSSLHGLIISDAYNITNLWIKLSNKIKGDNFKYLDYFMSVGRKVREPLVIETPVSKTDILKYKIEYEPICWDPEKLLNVSPFNNIQ